jgi:hypothetical protein
VSFGLAAGERKTLNFRAQPKEFDAAFEISAEQLRPEKYATYVYVDLVQPGTSLSWFPARWSNNRLSIKTQSLGSLSRFLKPRGRETHKLGAVAG